MTKKHGKHGDHENEGRRRHVQNQEPDMAEFGPDDSWSPQHGRGGWSDDGYQRGSIAKRIKESPDRLH